MRAGIYLALGFVLALSLAAASQRFECKIVDGEAWCVDSRLRVQHDAEVRELAQKLARWKRHFGTDCEPAFGGVICRNNDASMRPCKKGGIFYETNGACKPGMDMTWEEVRALDQR